MTARAFPPVGYRRRDGTPGTVNVPVGDWPWPIIEWDDGVRTEAARPSDDWVALGWAPRPRSDAGWFLHHLCHGLLMRYPPIDVAVWAWRNRREADHYDSRRDGKAVEL